MIIVECLNKNETVEGITYNYFYRLTKGNITLPLDGEKFDVQSYGIEIERQDSCYGKIINIERDSVSSISPQRHKVHNLLKMLHDHVVSPIHLIDVLGEYIDEYIIDFDKEMESIATN
jgi:hypothetical protein